MKTRRVSITKDVEVKKLVGVIGSGLVGRDPFDYQAWSGSSRHFLNECRRIGILERAFGVEVHPFYRYPLMVKNFSFDKERWRRKFYLDVKYYDLLTKAIRKRLVSSDCGCNIIQIGGIYDIPEVVNGGCKCYSYHDGNLAQLLKSPYMPRGIPKKLIDEALDYERKVYLGMEKIFTMSEYLKRSFVEDFGIKESKVKNIGSGINLDEIPGLKEKNYESKNILFVGVMFYRKGGYDLLKAFRIIRERVPEAKLHIVGPKKLKIPNEYSRGVIFHGFLSKKDPKQKVILEQIIDESSLFVMPSLYEPFGIAPLEAMVNQIPCILTNKWAFPEMVKPGVNGELVECGNAEELADKIRFLLNQPDLLKEMGKKGRDLVINNFTWEHVITRLIGEID